MRRFLVAIAGLAGLIAAPVAAQSAYERAGVAYDSGDLAAAAELYRLACDEGEGTGCTDLGYMYERGEGVAQDE